MPLHSTKLVDLHSCSIKAGVSIELLTHAGGVPFGSCDLQSLREGDLWEAGRSWKSEGVLVAIAWYLQMCVFIGHMMSASSSGVGEL